MLLELSFVVPAESVRLIADRFATFLRLAGTDNVTISLQALEDAPKKDIILIIGGEKEDVLIATTYILPKIIDRQALLFELGDVERNLIEWVIPLNRVDRLSGNIYCIELHSGAVISVDNATLNPYERLDLESSFVINNNMCQTC